jgi:ribosome-binding protein aMBF1 (putative translation factor)
LEVVKMINPQIHKPKAKAYEEFRGALVATSDRKAAGVLLGAMLRKSRVQEGISHTKLSKMANVGRNKIAKVEIAGFDLDSEKDALLFSKITSSLGLEREQISQLLKLYLNQTEGSVHEQMRLSRIASGMTVGELARQVNMKRWHLRVIELKDVKRGVPIEALVALELAEALRMDPAAIKPLLRPGIA